MGSFWKFLVWSRQSDFFIMLIALFRIKPETYIAKIIWKSFAGCKRFLTKPHIFCGVLCWFIMTVIEALYFYYPIIQTFPGKIKHVQSNSSWLMAPDPSPRGNNFIHHSPLRNPYYFRFLWPTLDPQNGFDWLGVLISVLFFSFHFLFSFSQESLHRESLGP